MTGIINPTDIKARGNNVAESGRELGVQIYRRPYIQKTQCKPAALESTRGNYCKTETENHTKRNTIWEARRRNTPRVELKLSLRYGI